MCYGNKKVLDMGTDIFFFTDVELLAEQTAEQAFGPIRNNENSQYRVTSLHSKKNELPIGLTDIKPNAYAICHGDIAIQPDSYNDNLVNLVLVPTVLKGLLCLMIRCSTPIVGDKPSMRSKSLLVSNEN